MVGNIVTADNLREAGIAAHMAASPNLLPSASVYFQDFNFGATMFDAAYGNVEGGSVGGVGAGVSDIAIDERVAAEIKRREEDDPAKDASIIVETGIRQREEAQRLMTAAHARSAELGREIALIESQFEAEMGDAWREQIANETLHPDQIPLRRDGESMND